MQSLTQASGLSRGSILSAHQVIYFVLRVEYRPSQSSLSTQADLLVLLGHPSVLARAA
jgi:hypothetical protein